jgi:hypothetical protein
MPTERFAPLARVTELLRERWAAAWWLGVAVGLVSCVGVAAWTTAPYLPYLIAASVAAVAYYRMHYGAVAVSVPPSRALLRANVPLAAFAALSTDGLSLLARVALFVAVFCTYDVIAFGGRLDVVAESGDDVDGEHEGQEPGVAADERWRTRLVGRAGFPPARWRIDERIAGVRETLAAHRRLSVAVAAGVGILATILTRAVLSPPGVVAGALGGGLALLGYYEGHHASRAVQVPDERTLVRVVIVVVGAEALAPADAAWASSTVATLAAFALVYGVVASARADVVCPNDRAGSEHRPD